MRVPAEDLAEQADAVLDHVRTGEAVELTSHGRAVALILPIGSGGDWHELAHRLGAPELRGQARYAVDDDLFSTGDKWESDR